MASAGTKDAARPRFQQLVAQIVALQSPTVRQVQAHPGDWGIDCFVGALNDIVLVWQAKFFIDGVGKDQQQEIRDAFQTAAAKAKEHGYTLAGWTLCIPVTMDALTTKWWDSWKDKNQTETGVAIELWDETRLEAILLSPDAQGLRTAYFGHPSAPAVEDPELPALPLPPELTYEEMLFVKQLHAADIDEAESAKRQFFNADIMRREVADKGVEAEVREVENCLAEVNAVWETRFIEGCEQHSTDDKLPGLYPKVMKAIEELHAGRRGRRTVPMGLIHRLGTMHHVVEDGRAGWTRGFREVARLHAENEQVVQ